MARGLSLCHAPDLDLEQATVQECTSAFGDPADRGLLEARGPGRASEVLNRRIV